MLKFKLHHLSLIEIHFNHLVLVSLSSLKFKFTQFKHSINLFNPDIPSNSDLSSNFYVKIFFSKKIFSPVNCVLNFKFFNENGKNS